MLALGTVDIMVIVQDILIVLYNKKKNSLLSYDLILLYQFITIFSSKLVFFKLVLIFSSHCMHIFGEC